MPVDPSKLDLVINKIKATYGSDAVHKASDNPPVARISTGSIALDLATNGGVPLGRWCHFYGGFSSCKTLTTWNIIRNAQEMGMLCAYYNIEKQFDEAWVKAHGVDLDKLEVVEGSTIEGVGTKLESLLGVVHVHVLDSLAAAVSIDELNAKVEDWQMGLAARAWGKVLRRANERFDDVENAVIMVNQVRDSFGYGGEQPPGGRLIEHLSSCSMYFRKAQWLYRDADGRLNPDATPGKTLSGDQEADGMEFAVRIAKSRVGPPLRTARLRLDFSTGQFDEVWTLTGMAKHFGLAEKTSEKSSYYKLPDGTTVQGENKLRKYIEEHPDFAQSVRDHMSKAA